MPETAQKTALFNMKGHEVPPEAVEGMPELVALAIQSPEPVEAPDLGQNICDDPNTPFVDESLPLPQMRQQKYEHERRVAFWRYTKWGFLILLVVVLFILGYLIRELNKVISGVSVTLEEMVARNDEDNEGIVVEEVTVNFDFNYQGQFHRVLGNGVEYRVEEVTKMELISKPSWFSWAKSYEPLAIVNTAGLKDTLQVVDGQYLMRLENTKVKLYEEAHRFLNDLLGSRGRADVLLTSSVTLWDKVTIPVRKRISIQKSVVDNLLSEIMRDINIQDFKVGEYDGEYLHGSLSVGIDAIEGVKLNHFNVPANQLHMGTKVKGQFIKILTIELESFYMNETRSEAAFKFPAIDDQLVKRGFLQKAINSVENGQAVELWLRAGYCKDSWLCDVIHGTEIAVPVDPVILSGMHITPNTIGASIENVSIEAGNDLLNVASCVEITAQDLIIPFNSSVSGKVAVNGFDVTIGKQYPMIVKSNNGSMSVQMRDIAVKVDNQSAILDAIGSIINGSLPMLDIGINVESFIQSQMVNGKFKFDFEKTLNPADYDVNITTATANISTHLEYVEVVESAVDNLEIVAHINVTNPYVVDIDNKLEQVSFDVEYSLGTHIATVTIFPFALPSLSWGMVEVGVNMKDVSSIAKHHMEEFIGKCISSEEVNFKVRGNHLQGSRKYSQLLKEIVVPISVANGTTAGANDFILDTTMHLFGKSVEVTVLNPFEETEIHLVLSEAYAHYDGQLVGQISSPQHLKIPSGVFKTPPMPVEYANSGAGWKVVREALQSGKVVPVDVLALVQVKVGDYVMDLLYRGQRVLSKIRI